MIFCYSVIVTDLVQLHESVGNPLAGGLITFNETIKFPLSLPASILIDGVPLPERIMALEEFFLKVQIYLLCGEVFIDCELMVSGPFELMLALNGPLILQAGC